jgi:hypothetical protein
MITVHGLPKYQKENWVCENCGKTVKLEEGVIEVKCACELGVEGIQGLDDSWYDYYGLGEIAVKFKKGGD